MILFLFLGKSLKGTGNENIMFLMKMAMIHHKIMVYFFYKEAYA